MKGHRQCSAIVEDYANGTSYSGLRQPTTVPDNRQCLRTAKEEVQSPTGVLHLCAVHMRLCEEGFIAEDGSVLAKSMIADVRRGNDRAYRRALARGASKFFVPTRFYTWFKKEKP